MEFLVNVVAEISSDLRNEIDLVTEECIFNFELWEHKEKVDFFLSNSVKLLPNTAEGFFDT